MAIVYADKLGELHELILASSSVVVDVCIKLEKAGCDIKEVYVK